jgi:hypothetical protein
MSWVIYQKKERKIVGLSADCEPELEKDFALEEVVRGLANAEPVSNYDALQVSDRTQARALLNTPLDRLVLRKEPKGQLQAVIEEPKQAFLLLSCDAPDTHPVDGIPTIRADGTSFTTITVQKVDEQGKPRQSNSDNDQLYLRTDYGALFDADGKQEINSIKLRRGQAVFRLVSEKARRVATAQVFNADANLQDWRIRIEFV